MTTPALRLQLALFTVLAALLPAGGALASGEDVIRDCTDDEVMSKTYAQKEYRAALRELAADADQYGNCRDVILRAQQAALAAGKTKDRGASAGAGGGGAGGGAGGGGGAGAIGSAPAAEQLSSASESERRAVEQARVTRSGPMALADASVDPAKVGTAPGMSRAADLPAPLAILLALLLAGTLAIGSLRIRRLVNARRA
ncbi:MAG: hypothetical protein KY433_04800 [Actinobacteria bacterium]|nr:hypothetical protein [Actinomycetota bacterium]